MKKTKKLINKLLEELESTGIIEISCEKSGISRNTFYRWQKEDRQFLERVSESMFLGTGRVSDIAVSNILAGIKAKDMKATIFWLTHRHPEFKRPYSNGLDVHDLLRYFQLLNGKERALRAEMEAKDLAGNPREEKIEEAMKDIELFQDKWFVNEHKERHKIALEKFEKWKKDYLDNGSEPPKTI
jgi:hypothetical protein